MSAASPPSSARELDGRVALVTGSNTGIGLETARGLLARGAHVIFACRTEEKAREAMADCAASTGSDRMELLVLDLADLDSAKRAAAELAARDTPLHILINNAGLAGQRGQTAQGFELAFGTNHLGHFAFTLPLLDTLRASAPARIVNVSSQSHRSAKAIDWDALRGKTQSLTGVPEYGVSKLCNVLFTTELARRLEGTGVTAHALHPGVIASDIWRRIPWPFERIAKMFMKSTDDGAATSLYCATAPELAEVSGRYYDDCTERKPSRLARDPALAAELWRRSEAWIA